MPSRGLLVLLIGKDLLQSEVEFAQIVLAEAILVPAYYVEDEALGRVYRQLFDDVPLGVQGLGNFVRRDFGVTEGDNEKLQADMLEGLLQKAPDGN